MKNSFPAKKIAVLALLTTLGLIAFLLESLLPPLFVPGAKPGLSNLFSLLALVLFSPWEAFTVLLARTLLAALFGGNVSALLYSLSAGAVSMALSSVLWYYGKDFFSLPAVSVCSAVLHNMVQLIVYCLTTGSVTLIGYAPILALCGVLSGAIVGGLAAGILRAIPGELLQKISEETLTKYNKK